MGVRPGSTELAAGSGCGCSCPRVCCREMRLLGGPGCWTAARRKCRGLWRLLVCWGDTCPELCTRPGLTPPIIPSPSTEGEPRADGQLGMRKPRPILWFPAAQSHSQSLAQKHATTLALRHMGTHLGPCPLPSVCPGHSRGQLVPAVEPSGGGLGGVCQWVRPSTARPAPRRPLALPRQPSCSPQERNDLFLHQCPGSLVPRPGLGTAQGQTGLLTRPGGCSVGRVPAAVRAATLLPQRVPGAVRGRFRGPPIET